jgi:glyoxylase-like metal-dependent hydrolase (beta-lactamase superfamily II)
MKEIVNGVHLLRGFPPAGFNIYAIRSGERWLLVDTSTKYSRRRILRQLPGDLEAIFITHAHRDHAGAMHAVAEKTGAPVWSSDADAAAIEGTAREPIPAEHENHIVNRLARPWWTEHHPVARRLQEGEQVAGFEVIAFPGHTPGQIGLWRESDRTVICADVMRSMHLVTGLPQLGEMPRIFTCDVEEARRSIRKLAALEANTVCFGHGRPLTKNAAEKINEFATGLPAPEPTAP